MLTPVHRPTLRQTIRTHKKQWTYAVERRWLGDCQAVTVGAGQQRSEAAHITFAKVPCNEWVACHASMVTLWKPQRKVTDVVCHYANERSQPQAAGESRATQTLGEIEKEQGSVSNPRSLADDERPSSSRLLSTGL